MAVLSLSFYLLSELHSVSMAGVPSDLLSYVHKFLLENGFKKAGKVLQKSCGEVRVF